MKAAELRDPLRDVMSLAYSLATVTGVEADQPHGHRAEVLADLLGRYRALVDRLEDVVLEAARAEAEPPLSDNTIAGLTRAEAGLRRREANGIGEFADYLLHLAAGLPAGSRLAHTLRVIAHGELSPAADDLAALADRLGAVV